MGLNFGGAVIDFDFHIVVEEFLDSAVRQFISGRETPEERKQKALMEAGEVALQRLGIDVHPGDAPLDFADAMDLAHDVYAVGMAGRKTVVLGGTIGLDQEQSAEAFARCSREHGAVLVFSFDDDRGRYMFSVFRDGARVRFHSTGPGLSDDEGERVPGEPAEPGNEHDHQMAVLESFVGMPFRELLKVKTERFDR
ncbi:hypothetical protein P2318_19090 [Myxococcaceae bacterium GXIMD 01537]